MSATISGVEGLRIAEHIVAQFLSSAVEQKAGGKHVKDMETCLKVLRGLIKVGDRLRSRAPAPTRRSRPDPKPVWVRLGPDRQPEAVDDVDIGGVPSPDQQDDYREPEYVPGDGS